MCNGILPFQIFPSIPLYQNISLVLRLVWWFYLNFTDDVYHKSHSIGFLWLVWLRVYFDLFSLFYCFEGFLCLLVYFAASFLRCLLEYLVLLLSFCCKDSSSSGSLFDHVRAWRGDGNMGSWAFKLNSLLEYLAC